MGRQSLRITWANQDLKFCCQGWSFIGGLFFSSVYTCTCFYLNMYAFFYKWYILLQLSSFRPPLDSPIACLICIFAFLPTLQYEKPQPYGIIIYLAGSSATLPYLVVFTCSTTPRKWAVYASLSHMRLFFLLSSAAMAFWFKP